MSQSSSSPSYPAIAVSLVPKLAALAFLYVWLTGTGTASVGKLGLAFGVLALFDAMTVASLRKGSVVEWSDISNIIGSLLGPMVLPVYATAVIGVIALGTDAAAEARRPLGGPTMERLANSSPSRFAGPNRSTSGVVPGNPSGPALASGVNGSASTRPMPPRVGPPTGAPSLPNGSPGVSPGRPPFGSRPPVSVNQRPLTKEGMPPSPTSAPAPVSAPVGSGPAPATLPPSSPTPATSAAK